jgi:hypothetical protein
MSGIAVRPNGNGNELTEVSLDEHTGRTERAAMPKTAIVDHHRLLMRKITSLAKHESPTRK